MLHRDSDDSVLWFQSHGGPLLLLDRQWLPAWRGYPDPALPYDTPGTDYARACAIEEPIGYLAIDPGAGLVLGDEPMATAWWPDPSLCGGVIMRWRWANDEAACHAALSHLSLLAWSGVTHSLPVPTGHAVIFDAAYSGERIEASLKLELVPRIYGIDTAEYAPDEETALLLHRLTLRSVG